MRRFRNFWSKLKAFVTPSSGRNELSYILSHANPEAPLSERLDWIEQLISWIQSSSVHEHDFKASAGHLHSVRIKFMLHLLERQPEWKKATSATLRSLFIELDALKLFSHTGLTREKGMLSEAATRVVGPWIPRPPQQTDASELFARVFSDESDSLWVADLSADMIGHLADLIKFEAPHPDTIFEPLEQSALEALTFLGAATAAAGLAHDVRTRLVSQRPSGNPFFKLQEDLTLFLICMREGRKNDLDQPYQRCLGSIENCRGAVKHVFNNLEEAGVSVALVYSLERLQKHLTRIEVLLTLTRTTERSILYALIPLFLGNLIDEVITGKTISGLARANLHLLSRKVVERAGATGEHYITHTKKAFFQMFRSGLGGGVITVGTALFKISISRMGAPIFFEGLLTSINYAVSFASMQLLGFTLATKQPSMTAPALAGKLKNWNSESDFSSFVDEVAAISRSQFIAAVGNVGAAAPISVLVAVLWKMGTGKELINLGYAKHLVEALNPFTSLTIPLAAFTGVLLWMGSLCAGWLENFFVYNEIARGIAENKRFQMLVGRERARKFSEWLFKSIAGVGGSICLGFLMGTPVAIGKFFGIPLDVRHVTLHSAALALCGTVVIQHGLDPMPVFMGCLGILAVGFLNFGVSFLLALVVAVRARDVRVGSMVILLRRLFVAFLAKPFPFFYPPKNAPLTEPHAEPH